MATIGRAPTVSSLKLAAMALTAASPIAASAVQAHEQTPASAELPVGDGKVTTEPRSGNVYSCRTTFRGGGARHTGGWFHGATWNPLEKPHVVGRVMWPEAAQTLSPAGDKLAVSGNGLPIGQPTGEFPIATSDPAYAFDTNPNAIRAQALDFSIPLEPQRAAKPGCLPMGMIGFTTTGVAFYNALDDAVRDAAAHEVQDLCDGHPQGQGQYHYHSASPCLPGEDGNALVGWALDGFPILGMRDAAGKLLTNADLDACHGRAEEVTLNGRRYGYAYRLTREYPYVMGCFAGEVLGETRQDIRRALGPPRMRRGPPGGP
jgi:YHYH protein